MWREVNGNNNYPSETCDCIIETTDGSIVESRFIAPTCSFVSYFFPTYTYKNVKKWRRK